MHICFNSLYYEDNWKFFYCPELWCQYSFRLYAPPRWTLLCKKVKNCGSITKNGSPPDLLIYQQSMISSGENMIDVLTRTCDKIWRLGEWPTPLNQSMIILVLWSHCNCYTHWKGQPKAVLELQSHLFQSVIWAQWSSKPSFIGSNPKQVQRVPKEQAGSSFL